MPGVCVCGGVGWGRKACKFPKRKCCSLGVYRRDEKVSPGEENSSPKNGMPQERQGMWPQLFLTLLLGQVC